MTYIIKTKNGELRASDNDVPQAKKPILCVKNGNIITKVATFNNIDGMRKFLDAFGIWYAIGGEDESTCDT